VEIHIFIGLFKKKKKKKKKNKKKKKKKKKIFGISSPSW
jgi:hypothetical protein